ncbi:methyltransferase domain-containing protein [Mycolicibacterium goodii]|uniref:Class I SAM-dependent methyltransferase n=1 Tax=Mycolicibacterium goodii TaxID=134601 RepID=A0ABS6HTS6_MYCGD|nr:methyltransferase domain-containing protein [Mycolicibacterium goodii]MBU8809035.1 class I SAM-dependent methyltransferase [Mycolicibacterium goodii]MBU8825618.1 class I SAM-dependent methyltransferase [Mycolicibacterium goodii]MBU8836391.1 class I SAM-dependent methyltransferase [Mycolicibacterium goodii]
MDLRIISGLWDTDTGRALRFVTDHLLCAAGVSAGMRVLNLHCGHGDLTFTVADRVGGTGRVVGVDPSADAVKAARARSESLGYTNVEFLRAHVDKLPGSSSFDAVVGRHVLTGHRDPVEFLRLASGFVRSRGVLAVHEMDLSRGVRSVPPLPELRQVNDVTGLVMERMGILPDVGGRLVDLFDEADLPPPTLFAHSIVSSGLDRPVFSLITHVMHSLLPYMSADEAARIDIATLERRLQHSASHLRSQVEFIPQVCAWVRMD